MQNTATTKYFSLFKSCISQYELPNKFTFPFCYQPHPIALIAAQELQDKLKSLDTDDTDQQGRMYGVLIVRNTHGDIGFLSALSGNNSDLPIAQNKINFVPPVFEHSPQDQYFHQGQCEVNRLNDEISKLSANPQIKLREKFLLAKLSQSNKEINLLQQETINNKKARKNKRAWLKQADISDEQFKQISIDLARASVADKKLRLALKETCQQEIEQATKHLHKLTDEIDALKSARKKLSAKLQKYLFKQYQLLNCAGEAKDLLTLFKTTTSLKPPAGSGDCAAPKLLQYAFKHQLTPICMAEFWWGRQPKSEIRKHQHFYPACQGKCQPILNHMLSGMSIDNNPLLENHAKRKPLEIVFQDEHLVVVNKPAELLSVPGKSIEDSVYSRIKKQFPKATGSLILHRLDMATSGLLMLALNERAHKHLQKQFINKEISKRYIAIIDGVLTKQTGTICLPLRGDFNDRPRQLVCHEQGKYAETRWQVIEVKDNKTKLFLYPITGRTHQLRVHCAHPDGLNMPIEGDGLYGNSANRLHLHAQQLSFQHPISKTALSFEVNADF